MRGSGRDRGEYGPVRVRPFTFDERTLELRREGEPVSLQPKPTLILAELVAARGRLVERSRLYEVGWGDTVVEFDLALNRCVKEIRAAVGDDAQRQWFIATVPRRGYRLVPVVGAPVRTPVVSGGIGRRRLLAAVGVAVLLLAALARPASQTPSSQRPATVLSFRSFGAELSGAGGTIQRHVERRLGLDTQSPESTRLLLSGVIVPVPDGAVLEVTLVRLADGRSIWSGRYNPWCERITGDPMKLIGDLIAHEVMRRS